MCLVQKWLPKNTKNLGLPHPPPLIKDFFINFTNFFSPSPRPEPCSGQLRRHFFLQTIQMALCHGLMYHLMWCIGHRYVLMNISQTTSHYHQKWTLYIWRGVSKWWHNHVNFHLYDKMTISEEVTQMVARWLLPVASVSLSYTHSLLPLLLFLLLLPWIHRQLLTKEIILQTSLNLQLNR